MKENLILDTPDGIIEALVFTCDICGGHEEDMYSFFEGDDDSGDLYFMDINDSDKHICEGCLSMFVV